MISHNHSPLPQVFQETKEIQESRVCLVSVDGMANLVLLEIRDSVDLQVGLQSSNQILLVVLFYH